MWLFGLWFTLVIGKRVNSGFFFYNRPITGQGAHAEVALTAEDAIQTLQLVKVLEYPWVHCEAKISLEYYLCSI